MTNLDTAKPALLAATTDKPAEPDQTAEVMAPVILSLGKKKNKVLKQLKRGKGSAMDEVMGVVEQVQANLGEQAAGKLILPVVVIYRKKERRIRGLF